MASDRIQQRIERLLDQIEQESDQDNWQRVLDLAKQVLGFAPDNVDAKAFLGVAEERLLSASPAETPTSPPLPRKVGVTPKTEEPTSFANGRYEVKRFLGEGGKKKVYLAQDTLLDREVAFALIKTEGLDETSRTRVTREAQAMGRLGSHPHIVTVFDLGEEFGQPFMVTELMGGGDVEGVVEDASDHKLSLEQAINITRETCRGLEFAHSRGIVHRDLKPGNVWLTSDGVAKIGDFGLAVAIDRSRLTTEGMMVGTVSYMPPEQAMGGAVTPKSDLYSLGAMLYGMVTGRPPFLGDDSVAIIGQHINTPPVAPAWHNSSCPRALEALILRLLAKDPSERPDSATDVLAALDGLDLTVSVETAQPADDAHALDSLAGGVFVGRQREMGELKACLEDALSGRGRLVTLVGEPGIGKTRTAQELATYAGLRSSQVLWGRCYEEQGMPPYWPWVQAIRSYVRERDPEQLRSEMGAGAADIAEVVSDVKERLPDLKPPPQLGSPEQARFRLFDSITAFLKSSSQKQPLVLVLDDLHWADQPSLLLLQFVARELGNSRLLLVGTYRDMELSRQHPLAETLGELTRERLFQRVLLRGLSQQDVARFIEVAAGVDPPAGLTQAVHTQTEGNPLFVTEVVRLLVQEGELTQERSGDRDSWTVRIPEGVREVIGRRLNRLSQRCNETLTIASVIGREFTLEQMKPLVDDLTEDRLLEVLEEALSARVIEELPQAVGRYQFSHALIQETLIEELTLTRRVRLHARIAETLEQLCGDNAEAHSAELAHHFAEAESVLGTDKLVHYSLQAGEKALAAYAWEEARSHFQRGLATKEGHSMDSETATLLSGLGRSELATLPKYRLGDAVATLTRAFKGYVETGDLDRALAVANQPTPIEPELRGLAQLLADALELVPQDSHQAGSLLPTYGRALGVEEGDYEGAQEAFKRALVIAQREQDQALEMWTQAWAGGVDGLHLHSQLELQAGLRTIELSGTIGNIAAEWMGHIWASRAHSELGDPARAWPHAKAALAIAERLRDRSRLAFTLHRSTVLSMYVGDWEAARAFSNQGLEADPQDMRLLHYRTVMEYLLGTFPQGETYLARFFETEGQLGSWQTHDLSYLALTVSLVARITGSNEHFGAAKEIAQKVLSSPPDIPRFNQGARVALGLIAIQQNDLEVIASEYEDLKLRRGTIIELILVDQVLGLLAKNLSKLDEAVAHFEDGLAFYRRAGYRPALALTLCDYADTLLQRASTSSAQADDQQKAVSLLDESLAISSELGMRPLMERVLSRREILKA